jgi:hypothetical protein
MTDRPICVTLERKVTIPGPKHYPAQATVFRAREHTERDEFMTFFGLNIGPEHASLTIARDNIRSIAHLESLADD